MTAAHSIRKEEGIKVTLADNRTTAAVLAGLDRPTDQHCPQAWP